MDPTSTANDNKNGVVEKHSHDGSEETDHHIIGHKSLGVKRIEAISAQYTLLQRIILFVSIFVVAYAYGLDGTIRYTYQPLAASALKDHGLIATISVARAVIAAAIQPGAAKMSDVFGRVEMIFVSVIFYVIGTIVETFAQNIATLAAGSVIYQIGYTIVMLMVEVVIADLTSLRSRLFFSYIPAAPFIINTWVSGNVTAAVTSAIAINPWRWGFGMWAIIFPVAALPLLMSLTYAGFKARKSGELQSFLTPYQRLGAKTLAVELFWQLDVVGIVLIIAVFGLILTPLTLAGGFTSEWRSAHIIAPLVIGFLCIPVFFIWERKSKHPLVPFHLLRDRGVWGALGIALFLNFAWYLQGDYLYTVVVVAFNQSTLSATRITSLYSFVSVLVGLSIGTLVRFIKQLKWIIVAGTCLFTVAFGLLIQFRGGGSGSAYSGVIGAQVLLGIAGGMFPYPAQASIQSCTKHENVATITGLYLATYQIGSALGNCVSGAYWTNSLPQRLATNLAPFNNATLPTYAYSNPFSFIGEYSFETAERQAVVEAYKETQKVLCIIGICLTLPLIAFGLCTRNKTLGKEQSLKGRDAEFYGSPGSRSENITTSRV